MIQTRIITDDLADMTVVLTTLIEHQGEVPALPKLLEHVERLVRDASYQFLAAADGNAGPIMAAGVVTFFRQPMAHTHVLAVEALWCRDDDPDLQHAIWRFLVQRAQQLKFGGVCITPRATNTPTALHRLVEQGWVENCPVTLTTLPLQKEANPELMPSAFHDMPIGSAVFFSVPAILVHTLNIAVDFSGREYAGSQPFYRGEGRLICQPHWKCTDLKSLASVHFEKGFYARPRAVPAGSTDPFCGSIAEQLLHQGGVGQGAVSVSTSFNVAANYATNAGRRDSGLVFIIDTERLRGRMKIFDASATLAAACPWIPMDAWTPLHRVVGALWSDLVAAGAFLEHCFEKCFERANSGLGSLAPQPDIDGYLSSDARAALCAAGIAREELLCVHQVFEEFAELALQRIGAADILNLDGSGSYTVETKHVGPMAYFEVFERIKNALLEARKDADPGWDNTPFGYLAKTARDAEYFTAGPIAGDFIVEACVVDRRGTIRERFIP